MVPEPLAVQCPNSPTDKQDKLAKKFGEGFTWTCYACGEQRVLVEGKRDYFYWERVADIQEKER